MAHDFPYLYRGAREDAVLCGELPLCEASFRENVRCARAIEGAIRDSFNGADGLREGCADAVLEQYGFTRTLFVLSNSLRKMGCPHLIRDDVRRWGTQTYVPPDGKHNRYFVVDTAAGLLEAFVEQTRRAYQRLELFGAEHCAGDRRELDFKGKVLVMDPNTLRESCWDPHNQLWYAVGGFGCSPTSSGRAVYAVCLGDGEETRWNRSDFLGVLDEQYLPDWAAGRLEQLRSQSPGQASHPPEQGPVMR